HLAIGTDFNGTPDLPRGLKTYRDFNRLAADLSEQGISDATIENIFHKNADRFFNRRTAFA
ncbi:MAG: membrane dipeptidase, partial [Clostridiales bacterium]|nr:membrane dipeptidase [Clostridiales bacterium]